MFIRPCEGRITSPFGYRIHPITHNRLMHWGIDIAKSGTVPILASANGKVSFAKFTNGYGNTVMIEHLIDGKLYTTVYAHLASIAVRINQDVKTGQSVGAMGTTGNSTGQHLHFEVHVGEWNNKFTNAMDPLMYIPLEVSLKKGDEGPNVKMMQQLLVDAGYLSTADGIFGVQTESAVKAYQNKHKLSIDGVVGVATIAKLKEVVSTVAKYRLTTGTFATKVDAEKAAADIKKQFGWIVHLQEDQLI